MMSHHRQPRREVRRMRGRGGGTSAELAIEVAITDLREGRGRARGSVGAHCGNDVCFRWHVSADELGARIQLATRSVIVRRCFLVQFQKQVAYEPHARDTRRAARVHGDMMRLVGAGEGGGERGGELQPVLGVGSTLAHALPDASRRWTPPRWLRPKLRVLRWSLGGDAVAAGARPP